jgi:hypothetical protein
MSWAFSPLLPASGQLAEAVASGGVQVEYTDQDTDEGFAGSDTKTFTSVNFGTAADDRLVFVNLARFGTGFGSDAGAATVTIGGVAATKAVEIADTSDTFDNEWWWAAVPTGTSGNVVVTFANTETSGNVIDIIAYAVTGADTTTPVDDTLTDFSDSDNPISLTGTIDVSAGGAVLAAGWGGVSAGSPTYAWTGAVEDVDAAVSSAYGRSAASEAIPAGASGRTITADITQSVALGQQATLAVLALKEGVVVTHYTLTADGGSFAVSGTAATLRRSYVPLDADSGAFAVSGTDADLLVDRVLSADSGSFTASGTDATLTYDAADATHYTLTAESGSISVSGTDATLRHDRMLASDSGSIAVTGTDATLTHTQAGVYVLNAQSGAITVTGGEANLVYAPIQTARSQRGDYGASEEEYQAQIRADRKRLKKLQKRKDEDRARLRRLIREAAYGPQPDAETAEEAQELLEAIPAMVVAPHATQASAANVARLEMEITAIHGRIQELETQLERHRAEMAEEDDLESLLILAA